VLFGAGRLVRQLPTSCRTPRSCCSRRCGTDIRLTPTLQMSVPKTSRWTAQDLMLSSAFAALTRFPGFET
jgi:hypothetical protein